MSADAAQLAQALAYLKALQGASNLVPGASSAAPALGGAGSALGVASGLSQGTPQGDVQAGLSAGKLGNQLGAFGSSSGDVGNALGGLGGALGLYNGLEQGGVGGDASAALSAAQLYGAAANAAGAGGAGTLAGTAGSGAFGLGGTGVLGAASTAALPVAGFLAMKAIFDKQSAPPNPEDMYKMYTNDAAGDRAAAAAPYNQPGEPWNQGVNVQQALNTEANNMQAMGQLAASNPAAYYNMVQGFTGGAGGANPDVSHNQIKMSARGGSAGESMSDRDALLRELYKGHFQHFDEGGGAYSAYTSVPSYSSSIDPNNNWATNPYNTSDPLQVNPGSLTSPYTQQQLQQDLVNGTGGSTPGNISSSGALSGMLGSGGGGLSGLWNGLSTGQQLGTLGALLAGAGAITNHGSNLTQQYNPSPPTQFTNTGPHGTAQNATTGPNMYGNFTSAPRQQVTPAGVNWATIGQGAMPSFFAPPTAAAQAAANPSSAAATPAASTASSPSLQQLIALLGGQPTTQQSGIRGYSTQPIRGGVAARGGSVNHFALGGGAPQMGMRPPMLAPRPVMAPMPAQRPMMPRAPMTAHPMMAHGGELGARAHGLLDGPGDGTSDDIPAVLSSGEYVVPAHVVSALGNGDNKAGAQKLDELQRNVRVRTGRAMAKNQHPTGKNRAKKPQSYMKEAQS